MNRPTTTDAAPIASHQATLDQAATVMRNMLRETEVLGCYPMAAEGLKRWLSAHAAREVPSQPQGPNVGAAVDALGALWFNLQEIEAVAQCIPLVQEHSLKTDLRMPERIDALSRAVCSLVGISLGLHHTIEQALRGAES